MPDLGLFLALVVYFGFFNNGMDNYSPPPVEFMFKSYGTQRNETIAKHNPIRNRLILPQHRGQPYPFFLATQKTSLYVTEIVSETVLKQTTVECASYYLCANPLETIYFENGTVTAIDLEITYIFLYVKKYEYKFYGIPKNKV